MSFLSVPDARVSLAIQLPRLQLALANGCLTATGKAGVLRHTVALSWSSIPCRQQLGMCPGRLGDRLSVCCESRAGTCDTSGRGSCGASAEYCVVSYCLDSGAKGLDTVCRNGLPLNPERSVTEPITQHRRRKRHTVRPRRAEGQTELVAWHLWPLFLCACHPHRVGEGEVGDWLLNAPREPGAS